MLSHVGARQPHPGRPREVSRGGVVRARREKATVATAIERLRIKTRDAAAQQVGTLSSGQPAESADRPLAARPARRTAPLRHHPRRRRRHEARHLRARRPALSRKQGAPLLLLRDRGAQSPSSATESSSCARGASSRKLDRDADAEGGRRCLCTGRALARPVSSGRRA